jgi:hypothetical protein
MNFIPLLLGKTFKIIKFVGTIFHDRSLRLTLILNEASEPLNFFTGRQFNDSCPIPGTKGYHTLDELRTLRWGQNFDVTMTLAVSSVPFIAL